ncbi:MAG: hypothetical protein U9R74_14895 [Pseudomonadota bacterium]|nr:hypothetical protein [Pseudomonadota bacterium]
MTHSVSAAAIAAAVFLTACSPSGESTGPDRHESGVFDTQTRALERAGEVEGVMDEAAQRQREAIDAQTR